MVENNVDFRQVKFQKSKSNFLNGTGFPFLQISHAVSCLAKPFGFAHCAHDSPSSKPTGAAFNIILLCVSVNLSLPCRCS